MDIWVFLFVLCPLGIAVHILVLISWRIYVRVHQNVHPGVELLSRSVEVVL